jgi:hypothetical protein
MSKKKKVALVLGFVFVAVVVNMFITFADSSSKNVEYDDSIKNLFLIMNSVPVMVDIVDTSGIIVSKEDPVEIQEEKDREKYLVLSDISDSVLSTLSEEEFELDGKFISGKGFYGNVTKDGFNELLKDSRVEKIHDNTIEVNMDTVAKGKSIIIFFVLLFVVLLLFFILRTKKRGKWRSKKKV